MLQFVERAVQWKSGPTIGIIFKLDNVFRQRARHAGAVRLHVEFDVDAVVDDLGEVI